MRKWLIRIGIVAAVIVVIFLLKATVLAPKPVPVLVVDVALGEVEATVTNSRAGTVTARRRAKLSPELGGQVVNGPNFGQYIIRTGNHTWADWDERPEIQKADGVHYLENVSQYVKKVSSAMVVSSSEITNWPADYGMPTMVDVTVFRINNEYGQAWYHTIEKIHQAIVEKEIPFTYAWSFVASGGEGPGPTWVLVFPFKSWKEYGDSWEPAFWKLVEEVYGGYETDLIRKLMNKAVAYQENYMAAYREDMSYKPPQ